MIASDRLLLSEWSRSGHPFREAIFLERPHRFAVRAYCPEEDIEVEAHLGDPGRLQHILQPGFRILLDGPFPPGTRKTSYTAAMVEAPSEAWVSLVSTLPNRLFRPLLTKGFLPTLWETSQPLPSLRAEVKHQHSRFDFVLSPDNAPVTRLETKSVTWADGDLGWFPDAPTQRGTRHLQELIHLQTSGEKAHLLFVVQRSDVLRVAPAAHVDPAFAQTLREAIQAGVGISAVSVEITPDAVYFMREVPVLTDLF